MVRRTPNIRHPKSPCTIRGFRAYGKKGMCIRGLDNRVKQGLTQWLKEKYWPNYTYNLAKKKDSSVPELYPVKVVDKEDKKTKEEREDDDFIRAMAPSNRYFQHVTGGTRVGNGFDKTITDCVNLLDDYPWLPLSSMTNPIEASMHFKKMNKKSQLVLKRLSERKNPYFALFIGWCRKNGCIPIASQFPVYCGLKGTPLDCVVWYPEQKVYQIIENKTGFGNYYNKYHSQLSSPYQSITDCPLRQHQLQQLGEEIMYKFTFPDHKLMNTVALYYSVEGVKEMNIPPEIDRHRQAFKASMGS